MMQPQSFAQLMKQQLPSGTVCRSPFSDSGGGSHFVGKVATGGLTAGDPSSPSVGSGEVDLYYVSGSSLASSDTIEVVTLSPIKTPADLWVSGWTDRFGANWVWRDLSQIKAKADSAISVGGSGTCSIWEGGSDTSENVTGYYNWIDEEAISSGDELVIGYDWAELKWLIWDAVCP